MLDGRPPLISDLEKDLTRKERSTKVRILWTPTRAKLRRMKASMSAPTPHDVMHLFVCSGHPNDNDTISFMKYTEDAVRELVYLRPRFKLT